MIKFNKAKVRVSFKDYVIEYSDLIGIEEISKKQLIAEGDWTYSGNGIRLYFKGDTTATFPKKGLEIEIL